MAKKGYPGLVLVPPSDRTVLRRRLLRGSLFIIALVWGASTFLVQPTTSDNTTDCPSAVGEASVDSSADTCGQPPSASESTPNLSEFSLTPLSQAEGLAESSNPVSLAKPEPEQPPTPQSPERGLLPAPPDPPKQHLDQPADNPATEKSVASRRPEKSTASADGDTRLAEQGDAFAQYRLGRHYAQRDGRQSPESVSWYKKASPGLKHLAETGNGQAMYVLGVMYAHGRGVARDPEQARRWLTKAVEHNILAAQPVLVNLPLPPRANPNLQTSEQAKLRKRQN